MRYLVAYDVEDDKVRYRVAKCLLGFGERVQKSVFECDLRASQFREMSAALKQIALGAVDSIRVYKLGNEDSPEVIGLETAPPDRRWFVV